MTSHVTSVTTGQCQQTAQHCCGNMGPNNMVLVFCLLHQAMMPRENSSATGVNQPNIMDCTQNHNHHNDHSMKGCDGRYHEYDFLASLI